MSWTVSRANNSKRAYTLKHAEGYSVDVVVPEDKDIPVLSSAYVNAVCDGHDLVFTKLSKFKLISLVKLVALILTTASLVVFPEHKSIEISALISIILVEVIIGLVFRRVPKK